MGRHFDDWDQEDLRALVRDKEEIMPLPNMPRHLYEQETHPRTDEELLIAQMNRIIGYVPMGAKDLLHILSGPDMMIFTERWLKSKQPTLDCEKFSDGWSCAMESDRIFKQQLEFGAKPEFETGGKAIVYIGFDWCDPCKNNLLYGSDKPTTP